VSSDKIESCGGCGTDGVKVADPVGDNDGNCAGLRVGSQTGAGVKSRVGASMGTTMADGWRD